MNRTSVRCQNVSMSGLTLGPRVLQAIALRGTTMHAVELAAGLSRGHLARLVTGAKANIKAATLLAIADHLDISCEWLLRGEGPIERSAIPRWGAPRAPAAPAAPAPIAELAADIDAHAASIAAPVAPAVLKGPRRR